MKIPECVFRFADKLREELEVFVDINTFERLKTKNYDRAAGAFRWSIETTSPKHISKVIGSDESISYLLKCKKIVINNYGYVDGE